MINLRRQKVREIMNKKVQKIITWLILLIMVVGIIASITAYAFL